MRDVNFKIDMAFYWAFTSILALQNMNRGKIWVFDNVEHFMVFEVTKSMLNMIIILNIFQYYNYKNIVLYKFLMMMASVQRASSLMPMSFCFSEGVSFSSQNSCSDLNKFTLLGLVASGSVFHKLKDQILQSKN